MERESVIASGGSEGCLGREVAIRIGTRPAGEYGRAAPLLTTTFRTVGV
jgi:hypothetical protein